MGNDTGENTKIAFLCPVAESVNPTVFQHTVALISHSSMNGIAIQNVGVTERTLIHTARNTLVRCLLETDCEWGFWMDADILCPPDTIVKLLKTAKEKNAKFVTGVYYQRLGKHFPVLWRKDPTLITGEVVLSAEPGVKDGREEYKHDFILPVGEGPLRADACGFGCVLTHRDMFEKIEQPWFYNKGDEFSEDMYFCVKARKAGFDLWVDQSIDLGHQASPSFIGKKDFQMPENMLREIKI